MNEPLKVAGYLRIDSGDKAVCDAELCFFEERLQSHAGWECVGVYFDNTPGSKTCPRPGLKRLTADCEAGKVGLIVTNSLTMLYEDTADSLQFVWKMQILSPPVHIRLEEVGIDTRNPQALALLHGNLIILRFAQGIVGPLRIYRCAGQEQLFAAPCVFHVADDLLAVQQSVSNKSVWAAEKNRGMDVGIGQSIHLHTATANAICSAIITGCLP